MPSNPAVPKQKPVVVSFNFEQYFNAKVTAQLWDYWTLILGTDRFLSLLPCPE
jgi:hypothetical protein